MAEPISFTIEGLPAVLQHLGIVVAEAGAATYAAVEQEAKDILAASKPLVPYKSGDLHDSGEVEMTGLPGGEIVAVISYGGHGAVPYAAIQHEDTTFNHPVGQHHYLSEPFYAATGGMLERLAARIRARMRV